MKKLKSIGKEAFFIIGATLLAVLLASAGIFITVIMALLAWVERFLERIFPIKKE